jgi:branched-chain amino acid aminotransferase
MTAPIRVWVDGRLVDPDSDAVSPLDHGITVGDGVFETLKVVDGVPFALGRHHARLQRSLAGMGLPPADLDRVDEGIGAVLALGSLPFGRLRYTITGGRGPLGSDRVAGDLTYVVTLGPAVPPAGPARLVTVPWTRNENAPTAGLKTTSYADNVVALAYARSVGADEAIFCNTAGRVCEGTGSNVFVVSGNVVRTPPASEGPLLGVTRDLVLEWAPLAGITVLEAPVTRQELAEADEVFITSSTRDVLGATSVDARDLWVGQVTSALAELFRARSATELNP